MKVWARTEPVLLAAWLALAVAACDRADRRPAQPATEPPATEGTSADTKAAARSASARPQPAASASASPPAASLGSSASPAPLPEPRTLRFAWRPPSGSAREYRMTDPEDQHRIVLTRGVIRGGAYPLVVAFHGQPRGGQAPRDYAFPNTVTRVTLDLVERGEVEPVVLATPVFRFHGLNWPNFDIASFAEQVARVLTPEGISISSTLLLGHSGAAGCGGGGLNRAHESHPAAVGFFDTCIGAGFIHEARALLEARIPTLIVHSLETAGFRPRQVTEYLPTFDFGKVYAPIGLRPQESCPDTSLEVPLRSQKYRCASDPDGIVQAFVADTGTGQTGHDAVVPVALRLFLRTYAAAKGEAQTR